MRPAHHDIDFAADLLDTAFVRDDHALEDMLGGGGGRVGRERDGRLGKVDVRKAACEMALVRVSALLSQSRDSMCSLIDAQLERA